MNHTIETISTATNAQTAAHAPSIKVTDKANVVIGDPLSLGNVFNLCGNLISASEYNAATKTNTKRSKQSELVDDALAACDELAKQNSAYHADYVVRGTQALYELLNAIYTLAIEIDSSSAKDLIIKKMRSILKERGIKTQKNTPVMTVLVKYVVGADRKTAANYSRVLQVAMDEQLDPGEIAAYISRRGGIGQIHDTETKQHAKKLSSSDNKERLELLREFMTLQSYEKKHEFTYDGDVLIHNTEKNGRAETASFCVFLTKWNPYENKYQIVSANDLGRTYEDSLLQILVKGAPNDLNVIRQGVKRYKKKLLSEGLLPPIFAQMFIKELVDAGETIEQGAVLAIPE